MNRTYVAEKNAPVCGVCGNPIHESTHTSTSTTEDYWDCECETDYIHPKTESSCPRCGVNEREDRMPDSHIVEVVKYMENILCRSCQYKSAAVPVSRSPESAGRTVMCSATLIRNGKTSTRRMFLQYPDNVIRTTRYLSLSESEDIYRVIAHDLTLGSREVLVLNKKDNPLTVAHGTHPGATQYPFIAEAQQTPRALMQKVKEKLGTQLRAGPAAD